ncbi:MAG: hypothetical protein IJH79_04470, partial [Lentisphaeria bacterium]|nr:hypothetical protein [Lentisphaeria bacterium]
SDLSDWSDKSDEARTVDTVDIVDRVRKTGHDTKKSQGPARCPSSPSIREKKRCPGKWHDRREIKKK